jgi:hypothetical protein
MSSENREILIRALEASGSEREAKLARAILGATPAAAAPTAPAAVPAGNAVTREQLKGMTAQQIAALPQEAVNAALAEGAPGPTPPAGTAPIQSLDEFEALPQAERIARMDEADALILRGDK